VKKVVTSPTSDGRSVYLALGLKATEFFFLHVLFLSLMNYEEAAYFMGQDVAIV
jgi:hypothetical protein